MLERKTVEELIEEIVFDEDEDYSDEDYSDEDQSFEETDEETDVDQDEEILNESGPKCCPRCNCDSKGKRCRVNKNYFKNRTRLRRKFNEKRKAAGWLNFKSLSFL